MNLERIIMIPLFGIIEIGTGRTKKENDISKCIPLGGGRDEAGDSCFSSIDPVGIT